MATSPNTGNKPSSSERNVKNDVNKKIVWAIAVAIILFVAIGLAVRSKNNALTNTNPPASESSVNSAATNDNEAVRARMMNATNASSDMNRVPANRPTSPNGTYPSGTTNPDGP